MALVHELFDTPSYINEYVNYRVSKKTIPLLIGIYFYITASTDMYLIYTIREVIILQGSTIETNLNTNVASMVATETNMLIFTILS